MGQHNAYIPKQPNISPYELEMQQKRFAMIRTLTCLYGIPEDEQKQLVDLYSFRVFLAGETLIHERETNEFFYIVLEGSVVLQLHDRDNNDVLLSVLERGDCCGEGALFNNFFPLEGAYAETYCYALQFSLVDMRSLLTRCSVTKSLLYRIYLRRLVESRLAQVPIFSQIPLFERLNLASRLHSIHYIAGDTIIQQGDVGTAFYIIDTGQVLMVQDDMSYAVFEDGDFFGEIALLRRKPHQFTMRAITNTHMFVLPETHFFELVYDIPHVEQRLQDVIQQQVQDQATRLHNATRAQQLHLAVTHGILRGTHVFVREPAACPPHCTLCEEACRSRHGTQRLHMNGVMLSSYDVLQTCRQCRVAPECVGACPEDAIKWRNHTLIINDHCTGCGDCVAACPYHAINRVPRNPTHPHTLIALLQTRLKDVYAAIKHKQKRSQENNRKQVVFTDETHQQIDRVRFPFIADKCDLCHGYDDYACVTACPVKTLRYVAVETICDYKEQSPH